MYWPKFESDLLSSTVLSLKKRSKALQHKSIGIKCQRVMEKGKDGPEEKLELEVSYFGSERDISLSVFIWDNRWVWIDIREPAKKGWLWQWEYEGRLLGNLDGRRIVEAIENTLSRTFMMTENNTGDFTKVWETLVARGPQEVE